MLQASDITEENLYKCFAFDRCRQNICPLDPFMKDRKPPGEGFCRWFQDRKGGMVKRKIINDRGQEITIQLSNATPVMPDKLLRHVPAENAYKLNKPSKERWYAMNDLSMPTEGQDSPRTHFGKAVRG